MLVKIRVSDLGRGSYFQKKTEEAANGERAQSRFGAHCTRTIRLKNNPSLIMRVLHVRRWFDCGCWLDGKWGGGRLLHYWRDFWKKKTTGNEVRVLK